MRFAIVAHTVVALLLNEAAKLFDLGMRKNDHISRANYRRQTTV